MLALFFAKTLFHYDQYNRSFLKKYFSESLDRSQVIADGDDESSCSSDASISIDLGVSWRAVFTSNSELFAHGKDGEQGDWYLFIA